VIDHLDDAQFLGGGPHRVKLRAVPVLGGIEIDHGNGAQHRLSPSSVGQVSFTIPNGNDCAPFPEGGPEVRADHQRDTLAIAVPGENPR